MSVLVDTGVFYAHADVDASRHQPAVSAFDAIIDGRFGQPYTSDYIYDETVTLTLGRTGEFERARRVGQRIRGVEDFPQFVEIEHVTASDFGKAVEVFERYDDQHLSFTDATTVALVERRDIDAVLSFDDDFDGLVDRIDPSDLTG